MKVIKNVGRDPIIKDYPVTSVVYAGRSYEFPPEVEVEVADDVADWVQQMYGAFGLLILHAREDLSPRPRLFFSDGITPLLTECTDYTESLRDVRAVLGPPTHSIRGVRNADGGVVLDLVPIKIDTQTSAFMRTYDREGYFAPVAPERTFNDLERSEAPELTSQVGPGNAMTLEAIAQGAGLDPASDDEEIEIPVDAEALAAVEAGIPLTNVTGPESVPLHGISRTESPTEAPPEPAFYEGPTPEPAVEPSVETLAPAPAEPEPEAANTRADREKERSERQERAKALKGPKH